MEIKWINIIKPLKNNKNDQNKSLTKIKVKKNYKNKN